MPDQLKKTISIHQPNFIPWIGFFYKILKSDLFVILDDVQYSKNSFINRNKIKTPQGEHWLTIPVVKSGKFGQTISECIIHNKPEIFPKILRTVESNYKKTPHFNEHYESFKEIFYNSNDRLSDLNTELIKWALKIVEVGTPLVFSSQLNGVDGISTDRLVSICKELHATEYLSGFGGVKYQEEELFNANQIKLITTKFKHPVYEQVWGNFISNMSIIDLIFNHGRFSTDILKRSEEQPNQN